MPDELRERLIVRIFRMRSDLLPDAERLLTHLECGNLLPLSDDQRSPGAKRTAADHGHRKRRRPCKHGARAARRRLAAPRLCTD